MTTWKMLHLLKVSHRLIQPISDISAYSYLGHEVKLSVFYPLDLLPDHHGSFQQSKAKLVQLNIKDINMNSSHLGNSMKSIVPALLS